MPYQIEWDDDARAEFLKLRAYDRNLILDIIEEQLTHEPTRKTRRKKIVHIQAPWEHIGPVWQLRVGDFRVYYDVLAEDELVNINAVRQKPPHKTTKDVL